MTDLFYDQHDKLTSQEAHSRRSKYRGRHKPERKGITWKYLGGYCWDANYDAKCAVVEVMSNLEKIGYTIGKSSANEVASYFVMIFD